MLAASSLAEIHALRGDVFTDEAAYDSAVADYRAALSVNPRATQPVSKLAFAYYSNATTSHPAGSWQARVLLDSALRYARAWLSFDSVRVQPLALLGDISMARVDTGEALAAYCRLAAVAPAFSPTFFALARIHLARRDTVQAFATYRALLRADSLNAPAHVAVGDLYLTRADSGRAHQYYQKAAALGSLALEPALRLAALSSGRADHAGAAGILSATLGRIERNREYKAAVVGSPALGLYIEMRLRLAVACLNLHEWDKAGTQAQAVLTLAPGNTTAQQLLASSRERQTPSFILW
jgi:tetratricopeptide (TPR) repeat protein